jgi:hypothetical protein
VKRAPRESRESRSTLGARQSPNGQTRKASSRPSLRALLGKIGNAAMGRMMGSESGAPVPDEVRSSVERAIGAPLDDARLVTGAAGDAVARAAGAEAVTTGDAIHLARDAPPLSSPAGERLIAHELVHVAQQRAASHIGVGELSRPGDEHERAADRGAAAARLGSSAPLVTGAAAPGMQRQPKPTVDARQQVIQSYFERVQKAQGGSGVTLTPSVRDVVRRIFAKDRLALPFALDALEKAAVLSAKPADLAAALARQLTEQIDPGDLDFLESLPGGAEQKGRLGRLGDLATKSAPYKTPDQQQAEWKFNYETGQLRKGQGGIDPVSVDVLQLGRILHGLPGAWKGPPPKSAQTPAPRDVPALDKALESISTDALVPADLRGTTGAGEYADAQEVARALARSLDVAHQQHAPSVDLRLGANYERVKDPAAVLAEVQRVIGLVKGALPHHAPGIVVKVFFGDKLVRTFTLVRSE